MAYTTVSFLATRSILAIFLEAPGTGLLRAAFVALGGLFGGRLRLLWSWGRGSGLGRSGTGLRGAAFVALGRLFGGGLRLLWSWCGGSGLGRSGTGLRGAALVALGGLLRGRLSSLGRGSAGLGRSTALVALGGLLGGGLRGVASLLPDQERVGSRLIARDDEAHAACGQEQDEVGGADTHLVVYFLGVGRSVDSQISR
ncbi:hypothetical protein PG985_002933 [Apiospora marii]|uniref:uncharacterized protein n=1 Tax=Apiospora marii TaxID=335849 RepID=UPI00312D3937